MNATIILLPPLFNGMGTSSLTLKKENRLSVLLTRVVSNIFVPRRNGIKGEWRKLHNEEFMIFPFHK